MVARWTQAMVHHSAWSSGAAWAPGRKQLYVDDPTVVTWGSTARRATSFSLVVLLWLVLGIPLSWRKGAVYDGSVPYGWIGVLFAVPRPGVARISLPQAFVDELLDLCHRFLRKKSLPLVLADALVGKSGRVAYVLPLTRPFVSSLYAALAACLTARAARAREAPPREVPCRRFQHGAQWLVRILGCTDRMAPVPNSREVFAQRPVPPNPATRRIEVDASPTGGGAVLIEEGIPTRCFACRWVQEDFGDKDVRVGLPSSQTFFEVLALTLAVELWCGQGQPTAILGDNTAALQEALSLKGKGPLSDLAQVIAVLRCSRSLALTVGHLPTEANDTADALSRQFDSPPSAWPFKPDQRIVRDVPLRPAKLWDWIR